METAELDLSFSGAFSADELHEVLVQCHVLGNCARRRFIGALLALSESRLYLALGSPSIAHYAEKHFGCHRSQTYEFLQVAKALPALARLDEAYLHGRVSWSQVREIAKAATAESQDAWIEFARTHSLRRLAAEVKDAVEKGRSTPRANGRGLPAITVRMAFDLKLHEHELVRKAFRKAAEEMGAAQDGAAVDAAQVLVFLARHVLATDLPDVADRVPRKDSPYTILYHQCTECGAAHMPTADGPVEIPAAEVERVACDARVVTISPEEEQPSASPPAPAPVPPGERDRANGEVLAMKVRLRDGGVCANPMCGRTLGLHAHHVTWRSHGGATAIWNEIAICSWCHSLHHAGLLDIAADPAGAVRFTPVCDLRPDFAQATERAVSKSLEIARKCGWESAAVDSARDGRAESACVDSAGSGRDAPAAVDSPPVQAGATGDVTDQDLVMALVNLGMGKREAQQRLLMARAELSREGVEPTAGALIKRALQG